MKNTVDNTVTPAASAIGVSITLNDIKENDVVCEVYNEQSFFMDKLYIISNLAK